MATLELYKKDTCPFCQKVMRFMEKNHIEGVLMKDIIEDPNHRDALVEKGGMNQVPALSIDGEILYESDDIIQYMKDHLLDGEAEDIVSEDPPICPIF